MPHTGLVGSNPTPGVFTVIKLDLVHEISDIQKKYTVVGRDSELKKALVALRCRKHVLLEGPVGVGKTFLASVIAKHLGLKLFRIDGDERLTERKIVGYWDPPLVLSKGYCLEAFVEGPLVRAMKTGGLLFINELNRLPESTQNVLLPVMDEGILYIPKLGEIRASPRFRIIATQNPEEHTGVTRLSEALRDRFLLIKLDYQPYEEEVKIVKLRSGISEDSIAETSVRIVRATRSSPKILRGASVRSAIDLALIASQFRPLNIERWVEASIMSLSSRVEVIDEYHGREDEVIAEIVKSALQGFQG